MAFNLFSNIFDKAKSGVNYLASGQLGADVYDATHSPEQPQTTSIVKPKQGMSGKDMLETYIKSNPITAPSYYATKALLNKDVQASLSDT